VLSQLAVATFRAGDVSAGTRLADEAIEIARQTGNGIVLGSALQYSAVGWLCGAETMPPTIALERLQEALRLYRAAGDPWRSVHALTWIAECEFAIDPARAVKRGREIVAGLRALPEVPRSRLIVTMSNVAQYYVIGGMHEDALALTCESLALALSANLETDAIRPVLPMALALTALGDGESGAKLLGFLEAQFAAYDLAQDPAELAVFARLRELLGAAFVPADLERLRLEGAALDVLSGLEFARTTAAAVRSRAA
jgi:hypothetical protein